MASDPTTLSLPPMRRSPMRAWTRDALVARVVTLEVENLTLARQAEFQREELRCAAARERHARRLERTISALSRKGLARDWHRRAAGRSELMPIDKTSAQISAILSAGGYVALPVGNILRPGDPVPTQAQLDAGLYDSPQAALFGADALSGNWTGPALSRGTAAQAAGVMGAAPVVIPRAFSLTDIACEVTAGVAATFVRMGVYADSGGYPGGLVPGSDSGQIDASAAAVKTFTYGTPIALPAGRYWLCGVSQGGAPTVAISTTPGSPGIFTNTAAGYVQGSQLAGYFSSGVTAALPATYPAGPVPSASVHRVAIKVT